MHITNPMTRLLPRNCCKCALVNNAIAPVNEMNYQRCGPAVVIYSAGTMHSSQKRGIVRHGWWRPDVAAIELLFVCDKIIHNFHRSRF